MPKSTTEHETQSDPGEPVELEKTAGSAQRLWPTDGEATGPTDGDTAADIGGNSPEASTEAVTGDPAAGSRADGGRKRGRRARRAAAAARGTGAGSSADDADASGSAANATAAAAAAKREAAAAEADANEPPGRRSKRREAAATAPRAGAGGATLGLDAGRLAKIIVGLLVLALLLAVLLAIQVIKGPGDAAKLAAQTDRGDAARQMADTQVARLFSFNYKTLDADFKAQRDVTTGPFTQEITNVTNPAVRPLAAKEHVVVQAVSLGSAVVDDSGSDVQVLVYLNQAVTLDLLPAPRLDRNRLIATMRFVDGQWKVAGIKAL
jgi:Mce-associated membrane protein